MSAARYLVEAALEVDRQLTGEEQVKLAVEVQRLLAAFKPVSVSVREVP